MHKSIFLQYYDAVLDRFDRFISWVVIVAMAVLTIVLVLQVFYRYFLNDSLDWGWDVPRVCFIAAVLFAIPLGVRYNAHVGIDLLVDRFGPDAKRAVIMFNGVFILLLSGIISYYAVQLTGQTWDQLMPGIPLSVGTFYACLAISQFHVALHVIRILITGAPRTDHWSET